MSELKIIVCPGCASTQLDHYMHEEGARICGFHCAHCDEWWSVSLMTKGQVLATKAAFKLTEMYKGKGKKDG
jgi:hypothetical protein